jgi:hypothetical protein
MSEPRRGKRHPEKRAKRQSPAGSTGPRVTRPAAEPQAVTSRVGPLGRRQPPDPGGGDETAALRERVTALERELADKDAALT